MPVTKTRRARAFLHRNRPSSFGTRELNGTINGARWKRKKDVFAPSSRLFPLNNFNLPVYSIVIQSDRAKVLGNNLHSAWKIIIERNFRYAEKVKIYPLKSNRELLFEKDKFRQFLIDARESKILSLVERRDDLPPPIFHEERERDGERIRGPAG